MVSIYPTDATTATPASSFNSFAKLFQVPGFGINTVVDIQRRNVEALTAANQTIAQGLQTVVQRQGEIARQSVKQFQDLVSFKPSSTSVTETLVKQIDVAKTSYEKTVTNARELGDLVAKVGSEAVDILSRRVVASLDEVKAAARPKAAGRTAVVA
jgi:phasin family protein